MSAPSNSVTPDSRSTRGADGGVGVAGDRAGVGVLDGAVEQWWESDCGVHDHGDAGGRVRVAGDGELGVGELGGVSGVDERDELHVHGRGDQRVGTGTASSASNAAITPNNTILDFTDAGAARFGRQHPEQPRRRVHRESATGRSPACASTRPPRTPALTSAACGAQAASCSRRGPSPTRPPPAGRRLVFSPPVSITAGTTYIASYLAPNGHFSMTRPGFSSAVTNGPLTAPASGSTTYGNGVYANGTTTIFPTNSYQATNYGVDVLFNPGGGGTAIGAGGADGGVGVAGDRAGVGVLDGAVEQWWESVDGVHDHGDAAGRVRVAGDGEQWLGDLGGGDGVDERDELHVHGRGDQRVGTGTASCASAAITPNNTILDFTDARCCSIRATAPRTTSASSSPRIRTDRHRRALLQGRREHRHPRRQPVEPARPAARAGHVHQRDRLGLADAWCSPPRSASPPAPPTSPPTWRPTATSR